MPTPILVEFEALVASINRRYGHSRALSYRQNPEWYRIELLESSRNIRYALFPLSSDPDLCGLLHDKLGWPCKRNRSDPGFADAMVDLKNPDAWQLDVVSKHDIAGVDNPDAYIYDRPISSDSTGRYSSVTERIVFSRSKITMDLANDERYAQGRVISLSSPDAGKRNKLVKRVIRALSAWIPIFDTQCPVNIFMDMKDWSVDKLARNVLNASDVIELLSLAHRLDPSLEHLEPGQSGFWDNWMYDREEGLNYVADFIQVLVGMAAWPNTRLSLEDFKDVDPVSNEELATILAHSILDYLDDNRKEIIAAGAKAIPSVNDTRFPSWVRLSKFLYCADTSYFLGRNVNFCFEGFAWDYPDNTTWRITLSKARMDKVRAEKAKTELALYEQDMADGTMVCNWSDDPPGERYWVHRIPLVRLDPSRSANKYAAAELLKIDGTVMGHCTNDLKQPHQDDLIDGRAAFYSLRREVNGKVKRVYTMKVELKSNRGIEVRGRNNEIPGFKTERVAEKSVARYVPEQEESVYRLCDFLVASGITAPEDLVPVAKFLLAKAGRSHVELNRTNIASEILSTADASSRMHAHGHMIRKNPGMAARAARAEQDALELARRMMAVPAFSRT